MTYALTSQHKKVIPHGKRWHPKDWDFYWDALSRILPGTAVRSLADVAQAVIVATASHEDVSERRPSRDDFDARLLRSLVACRHAETDPEMRRA